MTYIEGDQEHGFTLTVDGPTSLFKPSTRYGLDLAKLLPALLHVTKWKLVADIQIKDSYTHYTTDKLFTLDSECGLVSHYPPGAAYDSIVEESFAKDWSKLDTEWKLEREVELVPLPGSVMIPDFRLVHPSGRAYLLEIVGYWRPEYLRKKMWQVEHSERSDLILAVSEKLNLEKAGVELPTSGAKVIRYKEKLSAKVVLAELESELI
jgi:predicted nuclease of restriction endonuclease-like RecB superfamily